MELQEILNQINKLRDDLIVRIDHLSSDLKEQIKDHRFEVREDVQKLWDDQRRQDDCLTNMTERKTSCIGDMDKKIEISNSSWWKRFVIICTILMTIISSSFVYTTLISNQISKYQERIRIELEGIKEKQTQCITKIDVYSKLLQDHISTTINHKDLNVKNKLRTK